MYTLDTLSVQRWHLFREAEFKFQAGLTRIGGENASGKSLLMAAIPTIFSLIQKDDLDKAPKGSTLNLSYSKDEQQVDVSLATPSSSRYFIGINGEDMQPHAQKDAKNLLLRNWAIPEALFNYTIFLRGKKEHPLSVGTPGTRSAWLLEALDLTAIYDAYKQEVDQNIAKLGRLADKQEVLKSELDKTQARIPDSSISKKVAKNAAKKLKQAKAAYKALPRESQRLTHLIDLLEQIRDLPQVPKTASFYEKKLDALRLELSKLREVEERVEQIRDNERHNAAIQAKIDHSSLRFSDSTINESNLELRKSKLEKQERIAERYLKEHEEYASQTEERREFAVLKRLKLRTTSLEEAQNLLSAVVYRGTQVEEMLENLDSLDSDAKECPTCGNKLSAKHISKEVKRLKLESKAIPDSVGEIKQEVRYWRLKAIKFLPEPQKPDFSSKQMRNAREEIEAFEKVQALRAKLRPVEKVKVKNIGKRISEMAAQVKALEKKRHAAVNLRALRRMLPEELTEQTAEYLEYILEESREKLSTITSEMTHAEQIIEKYSDVQNRYNTQIKLVSQYRSTVNRLQEEIAEYAKELKDLDAWQALSKAFGNSGVRMFQLRESAAILSQQLTELSSLFFGTTYRFEIEVAPHKLTVQAERNNKLGSVKSFSGWETRCWNLLCAMAMLRILPSSMRCDTMILDEVEANMSKRARERYVKDVLPELATIVPKIIVVTPLINGEMPLQPNYDYMVVKNQVKGEFVSRIMPNG